MIRLPPSSSGRPGQRGTTLVESLLAFVVLAAGALTVGHLQSRLRLEADVARQRAEAVRLGEAELEDSRAWSTLGAASAARSYAAVADAQYVVDGGSGFASNTAYAITRSLDAGAFSGDKAARVDVRWSDRSGSERKVTLDSLIAGVAPAYAGALGLASGAITGATRSAFGRAPSIPVDAVVIDGRRSARKISTTATTAWLYDNGSGDIVARCDGIAAARMTRDLTAADLGHCARGRWLAVGGTVRFTSASPPLPDAANDLPAALTIELTLDGTGYPQAPTCDTEPMKTVRYLAAHGLHVDAVPLDATPAFLGLVAWDDTGERFAEWRCLVAPRADGRWSGRASLVALGWSIGAGRTEHRVCRFSADSDGSGAIDSNIEHPRDYTDVAGALVAQNFLVVRGSDACPAAFATVQHQP